MKVQKITLIPLFLGLIMALDAIKVTKSPIATVLSPQISEQSTLTVSGTGQVSLPSNVITINMSASSTDKTTNAARVANNEKVSNIKACLTSFNIANSDVATTRFNIYPNYNYQTNSYEGYTISQDISVRTTTIETAADIIDCVSTSEVLVSSVDFSTDKNTVRTYRDQLINLAIQDAQEKANTAAAKLGHRVSGVQTINVGDVSSPGPQPFAKMATMADGASTDLIRGNDSVISAYVSVVFTLSPQ